MYCLLLHFCDLPERTLGRGLCLSPCFQEFLPNMPWKPAGRLRGWHQSVQETVHITEARKQRRRLEAGGGQTLQRPALNLLPPSVPPEGFLGFLGFLGFQNSITRRKTVKTRACRAFWIHTRAEHCLQIFGS